MKIYSIVQDLCLTIQSKPWKPQKPVVIQFPVNDICNSRCQMCNIWQQKFDYQITPDELDQVLSSPLFSEVRSVGINGGEPTLREDLAQIIDTLLRNLPKLSGISLITNAFNHSQVIKRIDEIGLIIKSYDGIGLDVMVSMDGVGEVHDQVRGRKGNFENAVKVIDFIKAYDLVSNCRLGCTIVKENVYGIDDLLEFALSKEVYIKYRLGIPHQRLYSKDVELPFDLDFEERYHISVFLENLIKYYETSDIQILFYKSLIGQLMYKKPRLAGCDWQHRGVTLSSRGELLYCAVESKILGSVIKQDAEQVYFDNNEHLRDIVKNKCDDCFHDYLGLPPAKILLKQYLKNAVKKWDKSFNIKKPIVFQNLYRLYLKLIFLKKLTIYGINLDDYNRIKVATHFPTKIAKKRKILICGWYGTETLGDKAILGGIVISLKAVCENIELHLVSIEPYISEMTIKQMSNLLQPCQLHSVADGIKIADSMDLIVFGGGPLMAIPNIAEMMAIFQKGIKANIPTLIAGCGIGPLGLNYYNQSIKYLLSQSSHRIYRDTKSQHLAEMLGIDTSRDKVAEDPAFTWLQNYVNSDSNTGINNQYCKRDQIDRTLILGLRDWNYQEYANEITAIDAECLKNAFENSILKALEQLINIYPDIKIIPFPMCTNHLGGDDRWFYRKLFRNNSTIYHALDLTYLRGEINPLDSLNVFKAASAALTMRFHSLVFALSLGVPSVAIDYTLGKGKVKSLAEKHQVPYISLDSINDEFIVNSIRKIFDQPDQNNHSLIDFQELKFATAIHDFVISLEK